ncbi:MAG: hypothetical protein M1133_12710 [Armatimonadetes bacterium]|nr:hypothetical protein [Armatimonadota bacterium]
MMPRDRLKPKKIKISKWEAKDMETFHRNTETERREGGQPGNTNTLKHGIYANRFLSEEEKPLFFSIVDQLHQDFVFNNSSDFLQVELVAVLYLKFARAVEAGDADAAEKFDRMLRAHLRDLKATKITREGTEARGDETTPAEWATSLLEQLAEAEKAEAERLKAEANNAERQPKPEKTRE